MIRLNIIILLIPITIFIFFALKLLSKRINKKISKYIETIYFWLNNYTNILFSILFLFADGILILFRIGIFFSEGLVKKLIPDFLLILFTLCLVSVVQYYKKMNKGKPERKKIFYFPFVLLGGVFLLLSLNYKITGLDSVLIARNYFGAGVPLVEIQVLIAVFSGLTYFFLVKSIKLKRSYKLLLDVFVILFIFTVAFVYWRRAEIPINFFLRETGFGLVAPYSDSRLYDLNGLGFAFGQRLGFGTPALKPIYSFFLGLLHLIFKQDYRMIIAGQTFFLSLIPVIFYLLGTKFFNRGIGLSGAFLIIFHEFNLIVLSSRFTLSSLKMLMSEPFISVFILLFVLITSLWFNNPGSKKLSLFSGACLALCILIRIQMAPFIIIYIIIFIISQKQKALPKRELAIFLAGVIIVLIPWMSRNFIQSGHFVIEETGYVDFTLVSTATQMDQLYSNDNNTIGTIYHLIISQPASFIKRISSYLNNSLMSSLYQIPYSFGKFNNLDQTINSGDFTYPFPYKELSKGQLMGLIFNIIIIFCGLIYSWYKSKWSGINPLIMYLGYALITSLIGFSGWRFIQPVDWIILLYWCAGILGFFEIISKGDLYYFNAEQKKHNGLINPVIGASPYIVVILIGLLLPISEHLIPSRIQVYNKTEIFEQLTATTEIRENPEAVNKISTLYKDTSTIGFSGIALYPTFISSNDMGESKLDLGVGNYPSYYPDHQKYGYLRSQDPLFAGKNILFLTLANNTTKEVYLFYPKSVFNFNDGEKIIGIGCDRGEFIQAYWLKIGSTIMESAIEIPVSCSTN